MSRNINYTVNSNGFQLFQRRIQNRMIPAFIVIPRIAPSGIKTQVLYDSPVPFLLTAAHNPLHDFRRGKLRNILHNDPNCAGLLIPQSLGNIIGPVSHFIYSFQHSLPRLLTDFGLSVQDIRHCGRRNLARPGNFL